MKAPRTRELHLGFRHPTKTLRQTLGALRAKRAEKWKLTAPWAGKQFADFLPVSMGQEGVTIATMMIAAIIS